MPGAGLSALPDMGTAGLGSLPDPLGAVTDILEARRQGQTGNAPGLAAQWDALMQSIFGDSIVQRTIAARDALRRGDAQAAHEATMPVARDFASFVGNIKPVGKGVSALLQPAAPTDTMPSMAGDYRGAHRAPMRGDNAPLYDLTRSFPEDIYGPNAAQFYGHAGAGDSLDEGTARILRQFRGKPDAELLVYRAVPKDAPDQIGRGDWVTVNKNYAIQHGEGTLGGEYKIVSKKVRASDVFTDGNSMHEFGYDPLK